MPTFRRWLHDLSRFPVREREDRFKKTFYYRAISSVLQSTQLNDVLRAKKINLLFSPHPRVLPFLSTFKSPFENVLIDPVFSTKPQTLILDSCALITDFSSVFFDFAYLNRPVIYYQFDRDEYRKNHYKEGYFSYAEDGFGPIVQSCEDLVGEVVGLVSREFEPSQLFRERINKFFPKRDSQNCQRIVAAIENFSKN
jgi:CDP-glycerol glycerophosphotransferase